LSEAQPGSPQSMLIGVVGPCGSGKSTLVNGLKQRGWRAKNIAQEHSYVPHMWQRLVHPDLLVFLDVSHANSMKRRNFDWSPAEHAEQLRRLQHARQHADLYLDTNVLTIEGVLDAVLVCLNQINSPTGNR